MGLRGKVIMYHPVGVPPPPYTVSSDTNYTQKPVSPSAPSYEPDCRALDVTFSNISLNLTDVMDKSTLLKSRKKTEFVVHIILWTFRSDCCKQLVDDHSFYIKPGQTLNLDDTIKFRFGDELQSRPYWGISLNVSAESPDTPQMPKNKHDQVIAETNVMLSVNIPEHEDGEGPYSDYNDATNFTSEREGKGSPLHKLLTTGALHCKDLEIKCDDNCQGLHPWWNPRLVPFTISFTMNVNVGTFCAQNVLKQLPSNQYEQTLLMHIQNSNRELKKSQKRAEKGYRNAFGKCEKDDDSMEDGKKQYTHCAPGAFMTSLDHHCDHILHPDNCKADPQVLMNLLNVAAHICNLDANKFTSLCQSDPVYIVQNVYKLALVMFANGVAYEFDRDCLGRNGERYSSTRNMCSRLSYLGCDNSRAANDCEDYALSMCDLHVAFSHAKDLINEYCCGCSKAERAQYDPLLAMQQAIHNYTVVPITCSTYNGNWRGENSGDNSCKYQTHTCAILIPKGRVVEMVHELKGYGSDDIKAWEKSKLDGHPLPTMLLEGTACVNDGKGQSLRSRPTDPQCMEAMDQQAHQATASYNGDLAWPVNLQDSRFYFCANQMMADLGDGYNAYLLHHKVKTTNDPEHPQLGVSMGALLNREVRPGETYPHREPCYGMPMYDCPPSAESRKGLALYCACNHPCMPLRCPCVQAAPAAAEYTPLSQPLKAENSGRLNIPGLSDELNHRVEPPTFESHGVARYSFTHTVNASARQPLPAEGVNNTQQAPNQTQSLFDDGTYDEASDPRIIAQLDKATRRMLANVSKPAKYAVENQPSFDDHSAAKEAVQALVRTATKYIEMVEKDIEGYAPGKYTEIKKADDGHIDDFIDVPRDATNADYIAYQQEYTNHVRTIRDLFLVLLNDQLYEHLLDAAADQELNLTWFGPACDWPYPPKVSEFTAQDCSFAIKAAAEFDTWKKWDDYRKYQPYGEVGADNEMLINYRRFHAPEKLVRLWDMAHKGGKSHTLAESTTSRYLVRLWLWTCRLTKLRSVADNHFGFYQGGFDDTQDGGVRRMSHYWPPGFIKDNHLDQPIQVANHSNAACHSDMLPPAKSFGIVRSMSAPDCHSCASNACLQGTKLVVNPIAAGYNLAIYHNEVGETIEQSDSSKVR